MAAVDKDPWDFAFLFEVVWLFAERALLIVNESGNEVLDVLVRRGVAEVCLLEEEVGRVLQFFHRLNISRTLDA